MYLCMQLACKAKVVASESMDVIAILSGIVDEFLDANHVLLCLQK
jgi:hypothetical protein